MYHLHLQGKKSAKQETCMQLMFTLRMDVIHSPKTLEHIRTTWHYIPEDSKHPRSIIINILEVVGDSYTNQVVNTIYYSG
jgi:hypothetical protein